MRRNDNNMTIEQQTNAYYEMPRAIVAFGCCYMLWMPHASLGPVYSLTQGTGYSQSTCIFHYQKLISCFAHTTETFQTRVLRQENTVPAFIEKNQQYPTFLV